MLLTKTSWELSNSVHSFETDLVIYTALYMLAMVTPIPASKYSALSCIISKIPYQPL